MQLSCRERISPVPAMKVFSLYACFFAVFGVLVPWLICDRYGISYYPQDFYPMQKPGGDYVATYEAGRSILRGQSIYLRYEDTADWSASGAAARYSYPPPQAYLFAPLASLPFELSYHVWIGLTLALIVLCVFLVSRLFEAPWTVFIAGCAIYAQSSFIVFQCERGQTDALPLLCVAACIYFYVGRRNSYLAGLFCAIGACIKVIPAVFFLFFLLRRDWRAMLSTIAAAALIVFATGPEGWEHWWRQVIPAHSGLFIGQNVDHSLVYLFEAFTANLSVARILGRVALLILLATYAVLVLINRRRRRDVLMELAILTTIVEIGTPWSVNYKLVMLLFLFLAPFAILSIDRVRARPIRYTLPLLASFVLIVPFFGEYLTRLPFSFLARWLPGDLIISNPIDPIITDRKVALGIVLALGYLTWLYGRSALATRPLLEARVRRAAAAAFFGVRPRRALAVLVAVIVVIGGGFYAAAVLNPSEQYQRAIQRFGEPKPINDWASIAGYHVERSAGGTWTIDLIYESHGPMPKNLQVFFHAEVLDEAGKVVLRDGRNFFPSLITSYWPAGKYVVARTTGYFAPKDYLLKTGFFDLDDGQEYGEAEVGHIDLSRFVGGAASAMATSHGAVPSARNDRPGNAGKGVANRPAWKSQGLTTPSRRFGAARIHTGCKEPLEMRCRVLPSHAGSDMTRIKVGYCSGP